MTTKVEAPLGKLLWSFTRIGLLGFGGGPAIIPLVQQEVVRRHKWLEAEEFVDIVAIGNALPGPIATKLPAYIGFRLARRGHHIVKQPDSVSFGRGQIILRDVETRVLCGGNEPRTDAAVWPW